MPAHVPTTPFAAQLSGPVIGLAAEAPGHHVLTVRVSPEHLGPVTVQAHIGADGIRIELFSPTDVGRAAVHAVLADLRRDLAASGLGASLDLSARGAPLPDPSTHHGQPGQPGQPGQHGQPGQADSGGGAPRDRPRAAPPTARGPVANPAPDTADALSHLSSSARLDVIA